MVHADSSTPIDQADILLRETLRREAIIIVVESPGQSPTAVEHEGADDGRRGVSVAMECLGDGLEAFIERLSGEILYAVVERIGAGQQGSMRSKRQRHLRRCIRE